MPPLPTSSSSSYRSPIRSPSMGARDRGGTRLDDWRGCTPLERAGLGFRLRENCFERLVPGAERLLQLGIGDDERAEDAGAVRVDPRLQHQQSSLGGPLGYRGGEVGRRLLRLGVRDVLDGEHRAEPADLADLRVPLLPAEHPRPDGVADASRTLDEPLLLDDVEDRSE